MIRLRRASVIVSLIAMLSQLTSVATALAEDKWVLWRHYVSVYSPQIDDSQMWRAQPGTKTRKQCESEVKEYQKFDPGRGYRIEYRCYPDTVDPRGPKVK